VSAVSSEGAGDVVYFDPSTKDPKLSSNYSMLSKLSSSGDHFVPPTPTPTVDSDKSESKGVKVNKGLLTKSVSTPDLKKACANCVDGVYVTKIDKFENGVHVELSTPKNSKVNPVVNPDGSAEFK